MSCSGVPRLGACESPGFIADGRFDGDVLHHGGYLLYRQGATPTVGR
ncbi:Atu4866 domain-containing protein [Paractinoplanes bogorensis]|nr:Atu4866 domain-containing protein [Actinoplanes bogorensis]